MNKKIGIITGASSGMGKEFVRQLQSYALDELWVIARDDQKLKQLFTVADRIPLKYMALDLCEKKDLKQLNDDLNREKPDVRLFVHCAGVGHAGDFEEISLSDISDMVLLNTNAAALTTKIVLPWMKEQTHIILMASASGFLPQKGFAIYAATKSFVISFGKALRKELKAKKIYVTMVCPGPVDTPFLKISNKGKKQKLLKRLTTVKPDVVVRKALTDANRRKTLSVYGFPMKFVYVISYFYKG